MKQRAALFLSMAMAVTSVDSSVLVTAADVTETVSEAGQQEEAEVEEAEIQQEEVAVEEAEVQQEDVAVEEAEAQQEDVVVEEAEAQQEDVVVEETAAQQEDIAVEETVQNEETFTEAPAEEESVEEAEEDETLATEEIEASDEEAPVYTDDAMLEEEQIIGDESIQINKKEEENNTVVSDVETQDMDEETEYMDTLEIDWEKTQTNVKVPLNGNVVLEMYVTSSFGEITYQWYKYDPENEEWVILEGETASTLRMENVTKQGDYRCEFSDGNDNSGLRFDVSVDIGIDRYSSQYFEEVKTGDQIEMIMIDEASIPEGISLSYKWYHWNRKTEEYDLIESEENNSYTVTAGAGSERYECIAEDNYGNTYDKYFEWSMQTLWHGGDAEPDVLAPMNGEAVLEMQAWSTFGEVTYQWYKYDPENEEWVTLEGETSSTLHVENVTKHEKYKCWIDDGNESYDVDYTVSIDAGIERYSYQQFKDVKVGDQVEMIMIDEASLPEGVNLKYKWDHWNAETDEYEWIESEENSSYTVTAGTSNEKYWCMAEDDYGHAYNKEFEWFIRDEEKGIESVINVKPSQTEYMEGYNTIGIGTSFTFTYFDGTTWNGTIQDSIITDGKDNNIELYLKRAGDDKVYSMRDVIPEGQYAIQFMVNRCVVATTEYLYTVKSLATICRKALTVGKNEIVSGDTGNEYEDYIWYNFTAPVSGKYYLDKFDDLIIWEKTETGIEFLNNDWHNFTAEEGKTYYFGFNGKVYDREKGEWSNSWTMTLSPVVKEIEKIELISDGKLNYVPCGEDYIPAGVRYQITYSDNSKEERKVSAYRGDYAENGERIEITLIECETGGETGTGYDIEEGDYAVRFAVDGTIFLETDPMIHVSSDLSAMSLPELTTGENFINTEGDGKLSWYQFTAKEDGIYRLDNIPSFWLYKESGKNSLGDYGDQEMISLKKGTTYYFGFTGGGEYTGTLTYFAYSGELKENVPIAANGDITVFSFVPSETGIYQVAFQGENIISIVVCNGKTSDRLYDKGERTFELQAGEKYDIAVCRETWSTTEYKIVIGKDKVHIHDYKEVVVNAGCESTGYKQQVCDICGEAEPGSRVELPATGHKWKNVVDKAATCGKAGSQHKECSVCYTKKTATTIPATGKHKMQTIVDKAATCGKAGSQHKECSVCHTKEAPTVIKATGKHSFSNYVVKKKATALAAGTETRTCKVCGKTESRSIAKLTATIKLKAAKVTVKVGDSIELSKYVTGLAAGDSVAGYTSSNVKAAVVSKTGKVTGKAVGTTTVTVKLASKKTATITVTVQKKEIPTTSIKNLSKTMTIKLKGTAQLKPVISPSNTTDKLTYASSDKNVVAVSAKGKLTAKKAGKARITVQSGKKKFVIAVTVAAPTPTGMKNVPTSKNLAKGKTFVLKPILLPAGAKGKITYKSSNTKIAAVDTNGKITAKGKGTAQITITVGKVKKTCKVTVK